MMPNSLCNSSNELWELFTRRSTLFRRCPFLIMLHFLLFLPVFQNSTERRGHSACSSDLELKNRHTNFRRVFPADNSSALPYPGRSSTTRKFFLRMNLSETSTQFLQS